MKKITLVLGFLTLLPMQSAKGQPNHAVTTTLLRAAPGELPALLERLREERSAADGDLLIMRHSQGDHWDLMLIRPFNGLETTDYGEFVDFQHDFVATTDVSWDSLKAAGSNNGLYHVEMFHAKKGRYNDLLKQRRMENQYYDGIGRDGNVIFETRFGSDVDIFTVGFYSDLVDFAVQPDLPPSAFEEAAQAAGFSSQADLGLSLRRYILRHNDTLATAVD